MADIAAIKLENRVAELEAEQERLLQIRHRGPAISSITLRTEEGCYSRSVVMAVARKRTSDMDKAKENQQKACGWTIALQALTTQEVWWMTTSILHTSHHDSCGQGRDAGTHSRSNSRSSSSSRRRRSKWAIRKFTIGRKNVRWLNAYELIGASIRWFLSIDGLNMNDAKTFLEHLKFISVREMQDDFKDSMHIEYDIAIRRLADSLGFKAFSQTHLGISVKYYGAQNMKVHKANYAKRGGDRYSYQKKYCFHLNKEWGCSKTEEECGYRHVCSKCSSKNYKCSECKRE